MISGLSLRNFTVFADEIFNFCDGINVVIGSNGTGKSHLLKMAYGAARWSREMALREKGQGRPDRSTLQKELGGKLQRLYRPESLGRLSRRGVGVRRTEVGVQFVGKDDRDFEFSFSTKSTTDVGLDETPTKFSAAEEVEPITALDAELEQSQRYLDTQNGGVQA